jgi:hypothetical protein
MRTWSAIVARLIVLIAAVTFTGLLSATPSMSQGVVADHNAPPRFSAIPTSVVQQVRSHFTIFYGHTSHGSQILTGMDMLQAQDTAYSFNNPDGSLSVAEVGDDLGTQGDTSWVPITRQYLNQPGNEINLVLWSWCGGVSDNDEEGIATYLAAVSNLELQYPGVTFVYMTGHLDGGGLDGNLYIRNNQIREYCRHNGKVLFDFADIESYAPDGTYYPDESDACAWCSDWCATYDCPDCGGCAHSHCFNCYQKGKSFWWLMAKLIGWSEGPCCVGLRGNVDGDVADAVDISDLTALVDYLFFGRSAGYCPEESDTDGSGEIDISDLQLLIDYLFNQATLAPCN